MSKMMMGQIDHARKRVAELKAQKLGDKPVSPTIKGGSDLLKALRSGKTAVSPAQIKKAFTSFVDQTVSQELDEDSGGYYNNHKTTYQIKLRAPVSIECALATVVYFKENSAEVNRFEKETELFNLRQEALNLEATSVEDAIVLGDQHAALIALQNFAAFTL